MTDIPHESSQELAGAPVRFVIKPDRRQTTTSIAPGRERRRAYSGSRAALDGDDGGPAQEGARYQQRLEDALASPRWLTSRRVTWPAAAVLALGIGAAARYGLRHSTPQTGDRHETGTVAAPPPSALSVSHPSETVSETAGTSSRTATATVRGQAHRTVHAHHRTKRIVKPGAIHT